MKYLVLLLAYHALDAACMKTEKRLRFAEAFERDYELVSKMMGPTVSETTKEDGVDMGVVKERTLISGSKSGGERFIQENRNRDQPCEPTTVLKKSKQATSVVITTKKQPGGRGGHGGKGTGNYKVPSRKEGPPTKSQFIKPYESEDQKKAAIKIAEQQKLWKEEMAVSKIKIAEQKAVLQKTVKSDLENLPRLKEVRGSIARKLFESPGSTTMGFVDDDLKQLNFYFKSLFARLCLIELEEGLCTEGETYEDFRDNLNRAVLLNVKLQYGDSKPGVLEKVFECLQAIDITGLHPMAFMHYCVRQFNSKKQVTISALVQKIAVLISSDGCVKLIARAYPVQAYGECGLFDYMATFLAACKKAADAAVFKFEAKYQDAVKTISPAVASQMYMRLTSSIYNCVKCPDPFDEYALKVAHSTLRVMRLVTIRFPILYIEYASRIAEFYLRAVANDELDNLHPNSLVLDWSEEYRKHVQISCSLDKSDGFVKVILAMLKEMLSEPNAPFKEQTIISDNAKIIRDLRLGSCDSTFSLDTLHESMLHLLVNIPQKQLHSLSDAGLVGFFYELLEKVAEEIGRKVITESFSKKFKVDKVVSVVSSCVLHLNSKRSDSFKTSLASHSKPSYITHLSRAICASLGKTPDAADAVFCKACEDVTS